MYPLHFSALRSFCQVWSSSLVCSRSRGFSWSKQRGCAWFGEGNSTRPMCRQYPQGLHSQQSSSECRAQSDENWGSDKEESLKPTRYSSSYGILSPETPRKVSRPDIFRVRYKWLFTFPRNLLIWQSTTSCIRSFLNMAISFFSSAVYFFVHRYTGFKCLFSSSLSLSSTLSGKGIS